MIVICAVMAVPVQNFVKIVSNKPELRGALILCRGFISGAA